MTTLQPFTFTCPLCGNMFETALVTSSNSFGPLHSDFYREASGTQPVCYFAHSCTSCGFSGFDGDFQPQQFSEEFRKKVAEIITPEIKARKIEPNGHYYLVALCAEWQGATPLALGRIYQMGAWCHRTKNEPDKEQFFLARAAEFFERGIKAGEAQGENKAVYMYILGDLYRRLGSPESAGEWYRKAVEAVKAGGDPKIAEMAERQIKDPKDIL
ncbi:DUF2225 domain-containing protein [Methanocella sp. MCL-LM]|uniref:DUF2225 domain-containing protein n=1 Tax=Methanocella sp. MCL-LM TaxID=3412035 RepID=UPI003C774B8D